jgi:hypothetical protein
MLTKNKSPEVELRWPLANACCAFRIEGIG